MNEVIKALMERRSIRKYKADPVDEKDLELILKAATYAPSARGTQAWHITAIVNPGAIEELNRSAKKAVQKEGFDQYKDMVGQSSYSINFHTAPVFIIVTVDGSKSLCPHEDGSLVLSNIFLAAHSLGLGACWVNQLKFIAEESEFRQVLSGLGVPAANKLVGCAVLGHPAVDNPSAPSRREGLINIVK